MKEAVFIFRKDLRIYDNLTLNYVSKNYDVIHPVFFFTDEQVGSQNKYASHRSITFMKQSLKQLGVPTFSVKNYKEIPSFINKQYPNISGVFFNNDYTPYSIERDTYIRKWAKNSNYETLSLEDPLILGEFIERKTPYVKFTPFLNEVLKKKISTNDQTKTIKNKLKVKLNDDYPLRKEALAILSDTKKFSEYGNKRDYFDYNTTRINIYVKFGLVSPREVALIFTSNKDLLRQFIWRDFYYSYYYKSSDPKVYQGDLNISINWNNDKKLLELWKEGKTGYPIVDACMRQLKKEGYISNRARLIVSSFLSKNLLIDWREGERYFSQQLLDIDRIQNTAGWHSSVGVSKHSLPYFRIFNPWIQSKKYDKNAFYIKKWIPELKNVLDKDIHDWEKSYEKYNVNYPYPIVNYKESKELFLKSIKK